MDQTATEAPAHAAGSDTAADRFGAGPLAPTVMLPFATRTQRTRPVSRCPEIARGALFRCGGGSMPLNQFALTPKQRSCTAKRAKKRPKTTDWAARSAKTAPAIKEFFQAANGWDVSQSTSALRTIDTEGIATSLSSPH